jgi:hypothetical protein
MWIRWLRQIASKDGPSRPVLLFYPHRYPHEKWGRVAWLIQIVTDASPAPRRRLGADELTETPHRQLTVTPPRVSQCRSVWSKNAAILSNAAWRNAGLKPGSGKPPRACVTPTRCAMSAGQGASRSK